MGEASALRACPLCGLVQRVPALKPEEVARCSRCDGTVVDGRTRERHRSRTAAAALAGLVLYPVAVLLPVMTLERFGHRHEASVLGGSLSLMGSGEVIIGAVVFLASIVLPFLKLAGMLFLSSGRGLSPRSRARTHRAIELAGRWGLLDVLLVACVVAWVKIGDLVEVTPGPGVLAFGSCVLASLLASFWFDPHDVWGEESP